MLLQSAGAPRAAAGRRRVEAVRRVVPARRDVLAAARGARLSRRPAARARRDGDRLPRAAQRRDRRLSRVHGHRAAGDSRRAAVATRERRLPTRVAASFARDTACAGCRRSAFENSYAIAVRRATADSLHLATLSDLARAGRVAARGTDAGLHRARRRAARAANARTASAFRDVRTLVPAVKYQALGRRPGGRDRRIFDRRPHRALRSRGAARRPAFLSAVRGGGARGGRVWPRRCRGASAALTELSGRLDETRMRALNKRVEVDGAPVAAVARDALRALGLVGGARGVESQRRRPARQGICRLSR